MKTSLKGVLAIIEYEGVVLVPYQDSAKIWTIGVGHTKRAGPPDPFRHDPITLGGAIGILQNDLANAEAAVRNTIRVPLKQHQFDALFSFEFNTGGISSKKGAPATMVVRWLNQARWPEAMASLRKWDKATINGARVQLRALTARRNAEIKLFLEGDYSEPFLARVHERWPSKGVVRNLTGLELGI